MTTLTIPPGIVASERRNAIFCPTDTLSVATLTGPTALEIVCYLNKGTLGVGLDQQTGTDERECSGQVADIPGDIKHTFRPLVYVWEPQDDGSSDTNKAYNTLKNGTTGFIYIRYGVLNDTALAVGQKVDKYPVTLGEQGRQDPDSGNTAAKLWIEQNVYVGLGVQLDQELVA